MTLYRVARAIVLTVCRALFRVRVVGLEHVPRSGSYIVAPTHRSLLDIPFAAFATKRRIRFMAKEELFAKPWLARLLTALGGFPVSRGSADRAALRVAQETIESGEPTALFPEGTRLHGREVGPLFDGAAYLAARTGVPILPVGIGGSEQILSSGRVLPRLKRVAVVIGEPIHPPTRDGGAVKRAGVQAMTAELQVSLQRLLDEAMQRGGY
ncbi:MAG: lysophospholipid acyltransferase family protein [Actinomycetes bacterium]